MRRFFTQLFGSQAEARPQNNGRLPIEEEYDLNRLPADRGVICHAPFKSMRFEQRGIVRTCCFNRKVVLGRYPAQTLTEIWNGSEADQLRQRLKNSDFSNGCEQCGLQLKGGIKDTKMSQFDGLPPANGFPSMLDFSIHNTCNLECSMCNGEFSSSIRKNREGLPEMEMAYDDAFVAQLTEFIPHASRFVFAGGEPFLIDLYYKIWSAIMDLNPAEIHVVTNGTVLNNKVREVLERGSFHITHSMDSLVEDNFHRIRKNADFDRTMENRSYFMDYCKRKGTMYSMNVCPMQQNWEELPAMIEKCNADQVRLNLLSVFYPPHVSLGYLSKSQLENILVHYSTYSFVEDNEVAAHNVAQFTDLKARLRSWIADKNEQSDHPVAAASMADQFGGSIDTFVDHLKTRLEQYRAQHPEFNDGSYHEMILKLDAIRERCSGFVVSDEKMMEASNMDVEKMVRVLAATSVDALPDQVRSFLEADPSALY